MGVFKVGATSCAAAAEYVDQVPLNQKSKPASIDTFQPYQGVEYPHPRPCKRVVKQRDDKRPSLSSDNECVAMGHVAAKVLTNICVNNREKTDKVTAATDPDHSRTHSLFQGVSRTSVSVDFYCQRLTVFTKCSATALVASLIYIDRMILRQHAKDKSFLLSFENVHRLLIAALVISMKFWDCDQLYPNSYYARVGGILPEELISLESEFLFKLGFDLEVKPDAFREYCKHLNAKPVTVNRMAKDQRDMERTRHQDSSTTFENDQLRPTPPLIEELPKHPKQPEALESFVPSRALPSTSAEARTILNTPPTKLLCSSHPTTKNEFLSKITRQLPSSPTDGEVTTPETPKRNMHVQYRERRPFLSERELKGSGHYRRIKLEEAFENMGRQKRQRLH